MIRSVLVLALVHAGCWTARASEEPIVTTPIEPPAFVITSQGAGPFNASTVATAEALRKLVPDLRVRARDLGGESGVVFDVYDRTTRLFYVVPDDAPGWTDDQGAEHRYANTMFAVFAVSSKVAVDGRTWQIGKRFDDAAFTGVCECWGDHEVTACFQRGSHVRLIFEARCDDAETEGVRAMLGKRLARIMWKRVLEPADWDTSGASPSE